MRLFGLGTRLLVALPVAALCLAGEAAAQANPNALDLINRLRPGTSGSRGIRVPGSEPATPAPAPVPEAAPAPGAPRGTGIAAAPRPPVPAPRPAPARDTTAPAGAASVSITVTFPTGSATLTPQAERSLQSLGEALSSTALAPYRFRIEGHTDTVGDSTSNLLLSEQRAAAVRAFLVRRFNVAPARLESAGLGETQLLVATPDERAEARNRRVQIITLEQ